MAAISMTCEIEGLMYCFGCIGVLYLFFHFCWFIIGSVLFFKTVDNEDCEGTPIYSLGLALFIIKIVGAFCSLGKKSSE